MKKIIPLTILVGLFWTANLNAQESPDSLSFKEAEKFYLAKIDADDKDSEAYANLGNLYLKEEKFSKAIEQYTKAIDIYPYDPNFYAGRGEALVKSEENALLAIKDLKKTLTASKEYNNSELAELNLLLAKAHNSLSSNLTDEHGSISFEYTTISTKYDSTNSETAYQRAVYFDEKGFPVEANVEFKKAVRLDSENKVYKAELVRSDNYIARHFKTQSDYDQYEQRNLIIKKKE